MASNSRCWLDSSFFWVIKSMVELESGGVFCLTLVRLENVD